MHHGISFAGGLSQAGKIVRPRSAYWSTAKPANRAKATGRAAQPQQLRRNSVKMKRKPLWKPEREWDSSPLTLQEQQEQLRQNGLNPHRKKHEHHNIKFGR